MIRQGERVVLAVLLLLFVLVLLVQAADGDYNTSRDGLGLKGYDPVSYFRGTPKSGNESHAYAVEGVVYRFADADNLTVFQKNPQKYLPAYGGWCAWAMLEGDKVDIDPRKYKIIDGVNYLFYDGFWGDTLSWWNKRAEKMSDQVLVEQADSQWREINGQQ